MFDTRHLFNGTIVAALVAVTLYLWAKIYKEGSEESKKRFVIETSLIFGGLFALEYLFSRIPYFYSYDSTSLEAFYYRFITALAGSSFEFLIYLIAKFFYIRIPVEKRMRLIYEYIAVAVLCALAFYVPTINKENVVTPENLKLLEDAGAYLNEPSRGQNIAKLIMKVFMITSFYAIVRNWICVRMNAGKKDN